MTSEPDVNRPGSDYRSFVLAIPNAGSCRQACETDGNCAAYTYVRPGVQGLRALCQLKSSVPPARADSCCISGLRAGAAHRVSPALLNAARPKQPTPK